MGDVRVVLDRGAIAGLAHTPWMRAELLAAAAPGVARARAGAPHATGAGAASIHPEPVLDGAQWTVRVSWTRQRYYMRFHETGTVTLPARPFLVPAFESVGRSYR